MKKWDKEYATQYMDEVEYLKNNGVRYNFVKVIDEVDTYKYTKTARLFELLSIFYKKKGDRR